MPRRSSAHSRLTLVAILFGLNLLCFLGIAHGRHLVRHARVSYADVPPSSLRRIWSRDDASLKSDSLHTSTDHLWHTPKVKTTHAGLRSAPPSALACVVGLQHPVEVTALLARENVLALGGAPRAPGAARAPPAA